MDDRTFEVRCNASHDGQLQVKTHALSVAVSQLVSRGKTREMWQSILVFCEETEDQCLVTKIIVCHQIGTKICRSPASAPGTIPSLHSKLI